MMMQSLARLRAVAPSNQRLFVRGLVFLAVVGVCYFVLAWQRYPISNGFSIFRNTISHLGSPDLHRNPTGYRMFRLGFSCVCFLMSCAVIFRHYRMRGLAEYRVRKNTWCYLIGIFFILATIFLPDSREKFYGLVKFQILHGGSVVIGMVFLGFGILYDTLLLRRLAASRCFRLGSARWSFPFSGALRAIYLLMCVFAFALGCLGIWEVRCALDPTLPHWPGQGIFSTPLWEWIMFCYLVLFLCLFPRLLPDCSGVPAREKQRG